MTITQEATSPSEFQGVTHAPDRGFAIADNRVDVTLDEIMWQLRLPVGYDASIPSAQNTLDTALVEPRSNSEVAAEKVEDAASRLVLAELVEDAREALTDETGFGIFELSPTEHVDDSSLESGRPISDHARKLAELIAVHETEIESITGNKADQRLERDRAREKITSLQNAYLGENKNAKTSAVEHIVLDAVGINEWLDAELAIARSINSAIIQNVVAPSSAGGISDSRLAEWLSLYEEFKGSRIQVRVSSDFNHSDALIQKDDAVNRLWDSIYTFMRNNDHDLSGGEQSEYIHTQEEAAGMDYAELLKLAQKLEKLRKVRPLRQGGLAELQILENEMIKRVKTADAVIEPSEPQIPEANRKISSKSEQVRRRIRSAGRRILRSMRSAHISSTDPESPTFAGPYLDWHTNTDRFDTFSTGFNFEGIDGASLYSSSGSETPNSTPKMYPRIWKAFAPVVAAVLSGGISINVTQNNQESNESKGDAIGAMIEGLVGDSPKVDGLAFEDQPTIDAEAEQAVDTVLGLLEKTAVESAPEVLENDVPVTYFSRLWGISQAETMVRLKDIVARNPNLAWARTDDGDPTNDQIGRASYDLGSNKMTIDLSDTPGIITQIQHAA